ncbi:porin [Caulobacter sp. Root655]|uniref:OprO/OprP family phosphate-selective porin n=1 Tax=Caulobacter sp. Root655 TaxID=1736578 RepID=UPI0006FE01FA|nr:porin [Caulobacter sp. Root655]KRA60081.1 porin [Caulobacter sp. Root655]
MRILFATTALVAASLAGAAHAEDSDLAALKAQIQALQARLDVLERQAVTPTAPPTAAPAAAAPIATLAPKPSTEPIRWENSPRFTDASGATFKLRGRMSLDAVDSTTERDGLADYHARQFKARQLFLGVEGQTGRWAYRLEGGAVSGGAWGWDDAIIEYKLSNQTSLLAGNQKAASLEGLTSFKSITFMERGAYGDLIDAGYTLALEAVRTGSNWSLWAALQGDSINKTEATGGYDPNQAVERMGATVRATWSPKLSSDDRLHLGAWARRRDRGGETGFTYSAAANTAFRPQTSSGATLLSTGAVGDGDTTLALEGAWVHRALSLQAEAAQIRVDRIATSLSPTLGGSNFDIVTAYAAASWFPTGETRPYNPNGSFGRIKVLHPLDKGGLGAVELAARYDYADLSDMAANTAVAPSLQTSLATAGIYRGVTVGANWYPYSYVRLTGNLTRAKIDNRNIAGTQLDADVTVAQARLQVEF